MCENTIADTKIFSSFEVFESDDYNLNPAGYAEINVPDGLPSGYYLINGSAFFRYVNNPRSEGIPEGDLSAPYYYIDGGKRYTADEWKAIHGENAVMPGEEPSYMQTLIIPDNIGKISVNFSYKMGNNLITPKGSIISPDGTTTPLTFTSGNGVGRFAGEVDITESGNWKIAFYNLTGTDYEIKVELEEGKEVKTDNTVSAVLETEGIEGNTSVTVSWTNTEVPNSVVITSPSGIKYSKETNADMVGGETENSITFNLTGMEAGEWNATVTGDPGEVSFVINEPAEG